LRLLWEHRQFLFRAVLLDQRTEPAEETVEDGHHNSPNDAFRILEIAAEVKELAARAREKKLAPDEYTGATFSISNLGMFGIEEFTAIINPPEAGILAVGTVSERVVVEHGTMVIRPRMRLTMSCDHRVIDGATGARFLQTVRDHLEEPAMMLT